MVADVLGAPVKRVEDPRFITGKGRYLDDIVLQGMVHIAILRSPYAHANIRSIDTSAAKAAPGVLAVIVGADIPYNPLPMAWPAGGASGLQNNVNVPRVLATDSVKWTGEGVAAVVAETPAQCQDALELIQVDWEPLPAVVDAEKATQPGAPQLHENAPEQRGLRVARRRQGRHRRRVRQRRGHRQAAPRQQPAHPQPDGGPRRHRLVQPGHRGVHGLDVEPDAAHPAAAADGVRDRDPGAQGPVHQPRRRRRLRHQDLLLRGHGARDVREQAGRRPPGEVGRGPARELRQHDPRPRPHLVHRDRRDQGGRRHRPARQDVRQPRRAPVDHRPRHPHDALRPHPRGPVQVPQRLLRGDRRLHEHDVRRRLPRRRAPRGDLRGRTGDGPARGRAGHRPGRDPATELPAAGQLPVRQPVRAADRRQRLQAVHRLRELRARDGQGARDGGLRQHRREEGRGARRGASCSASGCRPTSRSAASRPRSGSARSARAGAPRCGRAPTSRST